MHKVFVFKEGRVRVKRLVAYGNYFKKKKNYLLLCENNSRKSQFQFKISVYSVRKKHSFICYIHNITLLK